MARLFSIDRSSFRRDDLTEVVVEERGRLSEPRPAPVLQKDDRAAFNEVFLPYMAEAYRLARWLTGNASDAEDVVQDAALRAFRGIRSFGAVNARAWSLTIVRNTAYSWLMKNRSKAVVFTDDLNATEQRELEHEGLEGTRVETHRSVQGGRSGSSAGAGEIARALSRSYRPAGDQSDELPRYGRSYRRSDRHGNVSPVPRQTAPYRSSGRSRVKT